jgi:diguanylate cyclase (GGDEF)-like protein
MTRREPTKHEPHDEGPVVTIQARLRELERRDWHLWCVAIVVMFLLVCTVASLSIPTLLSEKDVLFQANLGRSVRGLAGLVLIFSLYVVYQQVLIKRLRRRLASQFTEVARLQATADDYQALATRDPLTGLYNRRLMDERVAEEIARSRRHSRPLSALSLDLDDFKQINDSFGHAAGDLILKRFAETLRTSVRDSDVAGRMGGDEFLVLLPECPVGRAKAILSRIPHPQAEWENTKIEVMFTSGWAEYQRGESPCEFLERADQMLYVNKRGQKQAATPAGGSA